MENKRFFPHDSPTEVYLSVVGEQRQAMRYETVRGRNAEELSATEQKASALSTRASGFGMPGASAEPGLREQLQVS